jgi:hypothetical protein
VSTDTAVAILVLACHSRMSRPKCLCIKRSPLASRDGAAPDQEEREAPGSCVEVVAAGRARFVDRSLQVEATRGVPPLSLSAAGKLPCAERVMRPCRAAPYSRSRGASSFACAVHKESRLRMNPQAIMPSGLDLQSPSGTCLPDHFNLYRFCGQVWIDVPLSGYTVE